MWEGEGEGDQKVFTISAETNPEIVSVCVWTFHEHESSTARALS